MNGVGERKVAMTGSKRTADVEEKIEKAAGVVHEAVDDVAEAARGSIARAESAMEKAKEVLGEGAGAVKVRSAEAFERAKGYLAEAREALEHARERMGELYGRAREIVEEAYAAAKTQYERLAAELKKLYARIKAKVEEVDVKEMRDDVVNYVRRNPGKAVLIALAVGFAVGFLVRRREA